MAEPKRTFSFEEARNLLPEVRERTRLALDALASLQAPGAEDPEVERILTEWVHGVQELGAEVKGPWLVDFDSGAGYYCWKWPEERLEYFHGYEEGFTGRVRLQ